MPVAVRRARQSELGAVRDIVYASWLSTYSPLIGRETTREIIADRHSPTMLASQHGREDAWFLIAEDGGEIAGHLYAFADEGIYVDRLHVRSDLKGRGIGTALLHYLEKQTDGQRIWLDVLRGNDAALAFYHARGFVTVGETDECGGLAGIPAIILEILR